MFALLQRQSGVVAARLLTRRMTTTAAAEGPSQYSKATAWFHWLSVPAMVLSIGSVLQAQQVKGPQKGEWMFRHKSMGLLSGMLVGPRIVARLASKAPQHLPGMKVEHYAASASHWALYGFMVAMPVSGIAMGYFGGKGLPFFFTTIPGADKDNVRGDIAKNAFKFHKFVGTYGKYLIPLHVAGAGAHFFRGHTIFKRISPF